MARAAHFTIEKTEMVGGVSRPSTRQNFRLVQYLVIRRRLATIFENEGTAVVDLIAFGIEEAYLVVSVDEILLAIESNNSL